MDWISVKDRMPKLGREVVVYTSDQCTYMATYLKSSWDISCDCRYEGSELETDDVTHWMPIPEPPRD